MAMLLAWAVGDLSSIPEFALDVLCDFGEVMLISVYRTVPCVKRGYEYLFGWKARVGNFPGKTSLRGGTSKYWLKPNVNQEK